MVRIVYGTKSLVPGLGEHYLSQHRLKPGRQTVSGAFRLKKITFGEHNWEPVLYRSPFLFSFWEVLLSDVQFQTHYSGQSLCQWYHYQYHSWFTFHFDF